MGKDKRDRRRERERRREADIHRLAERMWKASGKPESLRHTFYPIAKRRLAGFRWRLHRLNRPFVWSEEHVIEPLDRWSDRANFFRFFQKISPILEAIGVLAIPFLLWSFENQRKDRQIQFQEDLVEAQEQVRRQQAVREYLSQIVTIRLEKGDEFEEDEQLVELLRVSTLALFEELAVSVPLEKTDSRQFNFEATEQDRKSQVVRFLASFGWIVAEEGHEPLLSLRGANLIEANLQRADLFGANLQRADLFGANLFGANLQRANLFGVILVTSILVDANLVEANLRRANLEKASLFRADLRRANLVEANLEEADLQRAYLMEANLQRANLEGASLEGAQFCDTIMSDGSESDRDCEALGLPPEGFNGR